MIKSMPIIFRGNKEILTIDYSKNESQFESGFDVLDVPFSKDLCKGYPTLHAYFENMHSKGYRRYCGFIQLVERVEKTDNNIKQVLSVDISSTFDDMGNPYFSYGYPASLYDAPCNNLGNCDELTWKAYTYIVDIPSRMNNNQLVFLGGFSWGYIENEKGCIGLLEYETLNNSCFEKHLSFISENYPHYRF